MWASVTGPVLSIPRDRDPAAGALSDAQRPALQIRSLYGPRQDHVRSLIERHPHAMVPDPGDAPGHIGLAGLMLARRQTKMRPDHARGPEAGRIIDGRYEGQRHDRAHARRGHQPTRGPVGAGEPGETLLDGLELLLEHRARA